MPQPLTPAALKAEIVADPSRAGYAPLVAAGNDQGIADLLNTKRDGLTVREPQVPVWRVLAWAADQGRYERLDAAATSGPPGVKSLARCALKILDALADVNLDDADFRRLLVAMIPGILTTADRDALLILGDRSPASRGEALFGPGVVLTSSDVSYALRGQR